MARTLYDVLMVSPKADRQLISVVYRHLAKRYHPDKDPSPAAAVRMAELNKAYAVLSDDERRRRYDEEIALGGPQAQDVVPGDSRPGRMGVVNTSATAREPHGEAGPPPANPPAAGNPLTFGRYRGWTLNQVARYDFGYIVWLSRTTMGRNYKRELDVLLRRAP
jgi:curved DNA-binding protein CbpA